MGLAALRQAIANRPMEEDYDRYDGPDIPAHLDEAPPLQPRDADYTHSVFFDPDRFRTQTERDELLRRVSAEFPAHLKWCLDPVSVATLHGRIDIYSAYHTKAFENDGYVAEIEAPQFWPPKRSVRCKRAWDAFFVHAEILEAVAISCRQLPGLRRRNLVFRDVFLGVLTPICGLTENGDRTRGANILCSLEGLFVPPRTFDQARIAHPADPFTASTASKNGREQMKSFYGPRRIDIRDRVKIEITAWSNYYNDRFSIDGIILSCAQSLALLRVQATEWSYRERRDYAASGTAIYATEKNAQATKGAHSVQHLHGYQENLRLAAYQFAPDMRRPMANVLDDVKSILAGGIGLEDEAIWKDDQTLRDSYSPQLLESVAVWVSRLKRMHHVALTGFMAGLIREIITGELNHLKELMGDGLSALRLVRSQLPMAVWWGILNTAIRAPDHVNEIDVRYRWNDNPTDPVAVERDGRSIVVVGPMIDMRISNHAIWTRRAELFRGRGTLTV